MPAFAQRSAAVALDTTALRPGAVSVGHDGNAVSVSWPDENSRTWQATFSLDPARPLISSISVGASPDRDRRQRPSIRGKPASGAAGGTRFSTIPRRIRKARGTSPAPSGCAARKRSPIGDRVELVFDGMRMGSFEGAHRVHVLSRQPAHPAGSGADDQRSGRRVLLRRRARHVGARLSHGRQQHEVGGGVLRHERRVEARDAQRASGRARAGESPLPHAWRPR